MGETTLTDPMSRRLVLADRTWFGHIVKGHPEVAMHRVLVENAVTRPDEIRFSRSDRDCRLYFGPGPRPSVRILVVANVVEGVVKTAHLCSRVSGGECEWSR
ncbi:MAG: hypothetical protein AABZ12_07895 [Planctomycetota bacterium]